MKPEFKKEGIVYKSVGQPFRYQGWPTVIRDEKGTLYAACSGYRSSHVCPMGKNLFFISNDGGDTWSCPMIINDTWFDDRDAGLTYVGGGRMLMTYFHNDMSLYTGEWRDTRILNNADPTARGAVEGILNSYSLLPKEEGKGASFIKISDNYGMNWSESKEIPINSPHGPILTPSGRLLYFGRLRYGERWIGLYESHDRGESWEYVSTVPHFEVGDEGRPFEPHMAELSDGTLLGAIRVEKPGVFTIYLTRSTDGGKTWSVPTSTGIAGSPPHLLVLSDGRLLMSYGRREAPFGSRAVISEDGGYTFGEEYIISEGPNWDLGYPSTVELDDGTLVTVHYQMYGDDDKTSILYTKWRP